MVKLNFVANFDSVYELVGAVRGIDTAIDSPQYLDSLANEAHNYVSSDFDIEISAMAGAGKFQHVYEFGVAGITTGPGMPTRIADPRSEAARLWVHNFMGTDGIYDIEYSFRPAVVPNPRPTTATTGVPSKVIRKLSRRKYVFWNKALVMETGAEVEIRPIRGKYLFVPFGGTEFDGRSYQMYDAERNGPIVTRPGRYSRGTFGAFWETWWDTVGKARMGDFMEKEAGIDVHMALQNAERQAAMHSAEIVVPGKSASTVSKAAASSYSVMVKGSKTRRGGRRKR